MSGIRGMFMADSCFGLGVPNPRYVGHSEIYLHLSAPELSPSLRGPLLTTFPLFIWSTAHFLTPNIIPSITTLPLFSLADSFNSNRYIKRVTGFL